MIQECYFRTKTTVNLSASGRDDDLLARSRTEENASYKASGGVTLGRHFPPVCIEVAEEERGTAVALLKLEDLGHTLR